MARGARRTGLASVLLATPVLALMASALLAPGTRAQVLEGTVRITPGISNVTMEEGAVTVFVVLEGLDHQGVISYDNDRDTVPDSEVPSLGLAGFQFTISYDPAVLAVAGLERGPALERTGRSFTCLPPLREPGSITFGCVSLGSDPPGPQGTLTLGSATFRPVGPGSSPLLLAADLAGPLGEKMAVGARGAVLRVTGTAGAAGRAATAPPTAAGRPTETAVQATSTQPRTAATAGAETRTPDGRQASPLQGRDLGTPSTGGGGSGWSTLRWLAVTLGSLASAGALGLGALLWRRRAQL